MAEEGTEIHSSARAPNRLGSYRDEAGCVVAPNGLFWPGMRDSCNFTAAFLGTRVAADAIEFRLDDQV